MNLDRRSFLLATGAATAKAMWASTPRSNPAALIQPPLVFIPGIKGSVLSDPQGVVRWITLSEALGLASPDLSLPLKWYGQAQERDGLIATAPLRSVAWHGVYASFLNWAAASGRVFRPFPYDWRRDNLETTGAFVNFLERVSAENGGVKVQVVAHSMGGLITFASLNRRPDLFHSILFAGVPFGRSINFLGDMHAGTSNGFNKHILSPPVLFTFVSPYAFFPTNPNESGLLDEQGNRIVHDWFSADDWARQKLGIFANFGKQLPSEDQREHLLNALARARQFISLLEYKELPGYPSIAVLASDAHPTMWTAIRHGPRAVKGWDFATAPWRPGDGRVDSMGALPPPGVPHSLFKSSEAHEGLLNDTKQVESILARLVGQLR